jgi:hypothetical protein
MMPLVSLGWDGLVFVLCFVGFFLLVFANGREGRRLLRRPASRGERRVCAVAGSILLLFALWVCLQQWRGNFGPVLWFGWLTAAALVLIFALAWGVPHEAARKGRHEDAPPEAPPAACRRPRARGFGWGAFALLPGLFLLSVWLADPWPVLRGDAVAGEVGPWAFTLAEAETAAPRRGGSGTVMKAFTLRFADAAQAEIRAAYLQARAPRSLRAAGVAFEGKHLFTARIAIPPAFEAQEGIWLTVEGRNGEVHHAAVDVARLSPALARFIAGEEAARKSDEGWDATLSCWNEADAVVCQGATFGSGETRFLDGAAIEVSGENGEVLLATRLNRKGEVRFPRPAGAFHVLMEEGPGNTVALNGRDVEAASAARVSSPPPTRDGAHGR